MRSSTSIFDHRAVQPRPVARDHASSQPAPVVRPNTHDQPIMEILVRPLAAGETSYVAFHRKEQELAQLFGSLSVDDARELHRRLCSTRPDELAVAFGRLVIDRQQRLLAVLAGARRRAAISAARGAQ